MKGLRDNNYGAVTVIVTLLLIPAILITGTGVDLARLYAARSTTRDANQLAANTVMTQYDAMLQDLYGLYAAVGADDALAQMVDAYVKASLFGIDPTEAQMGEFRLFAGTEAVSSSVSADDPLSDKEVLRRQIEEYAKWRVPVIVVKNIFERFDKEEFEKMSADTEAAAKKIAVDEQLEIVLEKFKAVKEKNDYIVKEYTTWDEPEAFKHVGEYLEHIRFQFGEMLEVRQAYEEETDAEKLNELLAHYEAISENIAACVNGDWIADQWIDAHYDDNGDYVEGAWGTQSIPT